MDLKLSHLSFVFREKALHPKQRVHSQSADGVARFQRRSPGDCHVAPGGLKNVKNSETAQMVLTYSDPEFPGIERPPIFTPELIAHRHFMMTIRDLATLAARYLVGGVSSS